MHVCVYLRNFSGSLASNEFFFVKGCYDTTVVLLYTVVVIVTTGILCSQQIFKLPDTTLPKAKLHIWVCVTLPLINPRHHLSLAFPSHSGNVSIVYAWHVAFVLLRFIMSLTEHEII